MAFGYLQQNASGYTQIDETYQNLSVIASGTGTTGTAVTFATQAIPPVVAVGVVGSGQFMRMTTLTTTSFTITSYNAGPTNFTFPYKVYAMASTSVPSGQFGMRVFNAAGDRTFDSNLEYLGIKYIQKVSGTDMAVGPGQGLTVTHGLGGSPYMIMNSTNFPTRYIFSSGFLHAYLSVVSMTSSTVVDFAERQYYQQNIGALDSDNRLTACCRLILGY